jgi:hypothetical protein
LLELKQEAVRLIILDEFGNMLANNDNNPNSKSSLFSSGWGNRRAVFYHPHIERKISKKRKW